METCLGFLRGCFGSHREGKVNLGFSCCCSDIGDGERQSIERFFRAFVGILLILRRPLPRFDLGFIDWLDDVEMRKAAHLALHIWVTRFTRAGHCSLVFDFFQKMHARNQDNRDNT